MHSTTRETARGSETKTEHGNNNKKKKPDNLYSENIIILLLDLHLFGEYCLQCIRALSGSHRPFIWFLHCHSIHNNNSAYCSAAHPDCFPPILPSIRFSGEIKTSDLSSTMFATATHTIFLTIIFFVRLANIY